MKVGIIGGSGLYHIGGLTNREKREVDTPFGEPSDELHVGELEGHEVVFLPRHGRGHRLLPSEVNYRANIWALKKLGVEWIISVSAVGSFKKEIRPLDIVLIDQYFNRTYERRHQTFFGDGIAAHIMFAHPVCEDLRKILYDMCLEEMDKASVHWGGTYLNMEGPPFSTKAESLIYKSWGVDVIGMTNATEAKLAREAEICYATMALVTDYDCWHMEAEVSVPQIIAYLKKNAENAKAIICQAVERLPEQRDCSCATALKDAIITDRAMITEDVRKKLGILLGGYHK